jgi:hypothetical protein
MGKWDQNVEQPTEAPRPGPRVDEGRHSDVAVKDETPAGAAVEGVQVGGLEYTENEDGTRNYPAQGPVDVVEEPASSE